MSVQPFLHMDDEVWTEIRDANHTARAIFDRHYSRRNYRDQRVSAKFVGPGEYMALLTPAADALFIWRKFISMDHQDGINCAVFRNEGPTRSSLLILAAMAKAWARWPGARLYTYVNTKKVSSSNPGYCFQRAGWRKCGFTKKRHLLVLECVP